MKNKRIPNKPSVATLSILLKIKTFLFLFLVSIQLINSQNTQSFKISDSLKYKTYKELYKGLNSSYNDSIKEKIYGNAYLQKAKNENDTIKIANAYSQFASITNSQIAIKYCDSIIDLTKNLDHFEYPGFGYMVKGMLNFNLGNYQLALENYLIANNFAIKNHNLKQHFHINSNIGQLKNLWGNYNEGLEIFKSQLKLLKQDKIDSKYWKVVNPEVLFCLSNSYILTKKLDSALLYSKKGLQESLSINDSNQYYDFVGQMGIIAYYQNNFKMALDSLTKALPHETSSNGLLNDYYYSGLIYHKQKKEAKAFYHFKKADSIYELTKDIVPDVRDIQEYFVDYYKKNNDIKNQLVYINRLLYVDSIIDKTYKNLNKTLVKKYDTPILLSEKEKIIANLKTTKKNTLVVIYVLTTLGLLSILFFIWYYRKQRILKARFKNLILNKSKEDFPKSPIKEPSKKLNGISKKIVKSVLLALKEFEINNAFLDNQLTLNSLSKDFNTNSNYLSKIINSYKEQNFSTYISNLRIDYCVEKLKTDTTFRKYTINAIAFEIGFNNVESFSKAFYKKTGIYPSYFIKEIGKQL